jgi:hypothetical protein
VEAVGLHSTKTHPVKARSGTADRAHAIESVRLNEAVSCVLDLARIGPASACHAGGRGFESCRSRSLNGCPAAIHELEPAREPDYARAVLRILLLAVTVAVLAAAGDGVAAHAAASDDRTAEARDAVVDLNSAISQEKYALHAIQNGSFADADHAISNSIRALAAVNAGATRMLDDDLPGLPDSGWMDVQKNASFAASYWDQHAIHYMHEKRKDPTAMDGWINGALAAKEKALKAAKLLAHPPCGELFNLQGPIMVNGVAQGPAQLTVSLSCSVPIATFDLEIPGATFQSCDGSGQVCTIAGYIVTLKVGGAKTATMTLDTENVDPETKGEGDVIPIAGDSVVVDETM